MQRAGCRVKEKAGRCMLQGGRVKASLQGRYIGDAPPCVQIRSADREKQISACFAAVKHAVDSLMHESWDLQIRGGDG